MKLTAFSFFLFPPQSPVMVVHLCCFCYLTLSCFPIISESYFSRTLRTRRVILDRNLGIWETCRRSVCSGALNGIHTYICTCMHTYAPLITAYGRKICKRCLRCSMKQTVDICEPCISKLNLNLANLLLCSISKEKGVHSRVLFFAPPLSSPPLEALAESAKQHLYVLTRP